MKKLLFAVFLILVSPAWALTFKSDGSVVQKDGTVVTKTTQERYAEALSDYRAGRTVSGFPTAKKTGGHPSFWLLGNQRPFFQRDNQRVLLHNALA